MDKIQSSKMLHRLKNHEIYPHFWQTRAQITKSGEFSFLDLNLLKEKLKSGRLSDTELETLLFGTDKEPSFSGWTKKRLEKVLDKSGLKETNTKKTEDLITIAEVEKTTWNSGQAYLWRFEQRVWSFRKNLRKWAANLKAKFFNLFRSKKLDDTKLWLNLGAGEENYPEYLKVDWNGYQDVYDNIVTLKKFKNNSVERIYCNHVLEHIPQSLIQNMLKRWFEILKPEGTIRVRIPDAKQAILTLNETWQEVTNSTLDKLELPHFLDKEPKRMGVLDDDSAIQTIYGWSNSTPHSWDLSNQHKSLWTPELTAKRFRQAGFKIRFCEHLGTLHTVIIATK